jgi:hypothetical protein
MTLLLVAGLSWCFRCAVYRSIASRDPVSGTVYLVRDHIPYWGYNNE